ncbi:hypothetical protein VPH35_003657 [Triticum aestivum]
MIFCPSRQTAAPSPPSPMESQDMLAEILLRLSPQPSSLPRASLVCKRWRRLVTDPGFLRRFRAHHCKQPIIGVFFALNRGKPSFRPTLDTPDSIPPDRFSLRLEGDAWHFHGCRHGRVLLTRSDVYGFYIQQVMVWDPVTGDQRRLGVPPSDHGWSSSEVAAAVVCAADRGKGHVHGGCPFKVVLVCNDTVVLPQLFACVYSSETGTWGNLISRSDWSRATVNPRNIMVGNSLYWFLFFPEVGILEFDLDKESFAEIEVPPEAHTRHSSLFLSTLTKNGGLGFITVLGFTLQVWERTADRGGVTRWVQGQTIELHNLLAPRTGWMWRRVLWIDGDHNVTFLLTNDGVYMVHLESMQYKRIFVDSRPFSIFDVPNIIPFTSLYAAVYNSLSVHCNNNKTCIVIIVRSNITHSFYFVACL